MRILLFLFAFFGVQQIQAGVLQSGKIDASTTNIPPTYTTSVSPLNVTVPNFAQAGTLCWSNQTGSTLALYVDNGVSTVAPVVDVQDIYVPGNTPGIQCLPQPTTRVTKSLLIRSASGGSVTSGLFYYFYTDRRG